MPQVDPPSSAVPVRPRRRSMCPASRRRPAPNRADDEGIRSAARIRDLTLSQLRSLDLSDDDLLQEALLRRGYPVVREEGALWMPRGPHGRDLVELGHHMDVVPVTGHAHCQARLELGARDAWSAAERILWIPSFRAPAWYEPRWLPWAWSDAAWSRFCRTASRSKTQPRAVQGLDRRLSAPWAAAEGRPGSANLGPRSHPCPPAPSATSKTVRLWSEFGAARSGRSAVVVVQQAAQPLSPPDDTLNGGRHLVWYDQLVV